jgi:hypothetical protein
MLMTWSSRERKRSCSPLSRRSRGRIDAPPITFEGRESQLQIRGNPQPHFARKSNPQPQFPANPNAGIPAISIAGQSLRDISRTTNKSTTAGSPGHPSKDRAAQMARNHEIMAKMIERRQAQQQTKPRQ